VNRTDWLDWRREGIGASDVAGILGLSPWASPWSVWADKVGLSPDSEPSDAMEFGNRAEPMLGEWFQDRTGLYISGEQTWCSHPDDPWMRCTVDGFVHEGPDQALDAALGVAEFKTTSEAEWDEVPAHYQCQATWQALVTGMDRVWFGVLHLAFGRPRFAVYQFTPTDNDKATVRDLCRRFWHDHVLTGVPPEVDGSDATTDALNAAWPLTDPDHPVDVSADLELVTLAAVKADIKRLEGEKARLENEIRAALGEHETGTCGGWRLSWKPQDRTSIDAKALRAAHPDIADQFTNTTTSRVLRITAPSTPKGEQ
jgi:putative phage-type endonuclease